MSNVKIEESRLLASNEKSRRGRPKKNTKKWFFASLFIHEAIFADKHVWLDIFYDYSFVNYLLQFSRLGENYVSFTKREIIKKEIS